MDKSDKSFLERIRTKVTRAIIDYDLIAPNDAVVIGISGGKDSMALLDILSNRQKSSKIAYNLIAVHIKLTDVPYYTDGDYLEKFCKDRNIKFHLITDNSKIITDRKKPCFYCAWNRRKLLFQFVAEHKYEKVALGHHKDDAVETLLMNMIQHGEISSFPVKLQMFEGAFDIIRPLIYTTDKELQRYTNLIGYEVLPYDCKYASDNQREKVKTLINQLYTLSPNATKNIFKAMSNIDLRHLPIKASKHK